jgi:type II secretory pathway pseudopilin PulG
MRSGGFAVGADGRGRLRDKSKKRGIALVTVLVMTMILLVLTIAFLYYAERGYRFAGLQERQNQAYFLALAGLEYYKARPEEFIETPTVKRPLPIDSTTNFFEVTLRDNGDLICKGILYSPLSGLSETKAIERTLTVPQGEVEKLYDSTQTY